MKSGKAGTIVVGATSVGRSTRSGGQGRNRSTGTQIFRRIQESEILANEATRAPDADSYSPEHQVTRLPAARCHQRIERRHVQRPRTVLISAEEYERLKRRDRRVIAG